MDGERQTGIRTRSGWPTRLMAQCGNMNVEPSSPINGPLSLACGASHGSFVRVAHTLERARSHVVAQPLGRLVGARGKMMLPKPGHHRRIVAQFQNPLRPVALG